MISRGSLRKFHLFCLRPLFIHNSFRCLSSNLNMLAVIQMSSTNKKTENLEKIKELVSKAAEDGAKMVFLPEASDFVATSRDEALTLAETVDGEFLGALRGLSSKLNIWISIGSMHRKPAPLAEDQRVWNTHIILNNQGEIVGMYNKTHLFGIDFNQGLQQEKNEPKQLVVQESRYMQPGSVAPVVVRGTPVGDVGLAICYDLRFPELAGALRYKCGANVLTYPAAFSFPTGNAGHWHTLLRARAIENQCYVIAAAQEGNHHHNYTTYGHSVVIDPWGKIVAERTEPGPGYFLARIHHRPTDGETVDNGLHYTEQTRRILPVEGSRRRDLFPLPDVGEPIPIGTNDVKFGPMTLKADQVFYRTPVSMAFVNISPLVPGHILVTPVDVVERFTSLPTGTIADMYACVKRISEKLCDHFKASSLTISLQDGKDAGQKVPHVHIHVLPRKTGDFNRNDDIYDALFSHDKDANRKSRSGEEMAAEARLFRTFFYDQKGLPLRQQ